jgi:hypothetical protein
MSKLASFSNKKKEEICIHYISFNKEVNSIFCSRINDLADKNTPIFVIYKHEIVFINKKIFETTDVIYIVKKVFNDRVLSNVAAFADDDFLDSLIENLIL